MKHEKFVWMILAQLICLKGFCLSTQSTEKNEATITNNITPTSYLLVNSSALVGNKELFEIFHGGSSITKTTGNGITNNTKTVTEVLDVENMTIADDDHITELSLNDTLKTNYTVLTEAVASQDDFRLESTGAIAAGVFLISAVVGYFSCVGYRRFMQKKYGNSQILAGEDVYDTRDLRYFEI